MDTLNLPDFTGTPSGFHFIPNTLEESLQHGSEGFNFNIYDHIVRDRIEFLPSHWHHEFEINYVVYGETEFISDGTRLNLTSGQALMTDRYVIHGSQPQKRGSYRFISIVFGESLLAPDPNDLVFRKYLLPLLRNQKSLPALIEGECDWERKTLDLIREIIECALRKEPAYELDIKILLLSLFRILIKNNALVEAAVRNKTADVRIKESINYIHEHYSENIKVSDIAASVNLCPEHFIRSFKALTGRTPKDYLIQYRINHVMTLIASRNESITEIALRCGFADMCYLSRCFKNHVGLSPQAYRKSLESRA